ncbi:MAG: MBOAT family O-acyltransferase [Flavobacteriales bacterium]
MTDFLVGKQLHKATKKSTRRSWLGLSLFVNLGALAFFKYCNFFIESASLLLDSVGLNTSFSSLNIILPVGISFYTFQTLSYTIDIYRRQIEPATNAIQFFAFVSFFPQLVAGPIERASNLLPQFSTKRIFNSHFAITGLRLILWGLFKKMVIADRLAVLVDIIYESPEQANATTVFLGATLFAYQLYCDFSGYSDIAIGTARLFGFRLSRNFATPFLASSLTELWQRWHISLSTWFRDYLYIPLGGSRTTRLRWAINILITFTISGMWHGADFHYVFWGLLCGATLVMERLIKLKKAGFLYTFVLFSFLMIMFRSDSIPTAFSMYQTFFEFGFGGLSLLSSNLPQAIDLHYTLGLLGVFSVAEFVLKKVDFDVYLSRLNGPARWTVYYAISTIILLFGVMDNAPKFIYFQF